MSVETHRAELVDQSLPMPRRFRALFTLRSIGGDDAIAALLGSLEDPSALFRHEVAFALGQMQAPGAVETLKRVLRDTGDDEMVRHECAEALGAIATEECLDALREACEDGTQVVRETAVLALQRFRYAQAKRRDAQAKNARADAKAPSSPPSARPDERAGSAKEQLSASTNGHQQSLDEPDSPYISVDPVPAAPSDVPTHALRTTLLDESASLWDRYGAMFALRNRGDPCDVAKALGSVLIHSDSALLKHEVCYVLGQIQEKGDGARAALRATLENQNEHPMVRHEAAEAIGSIAAADTEDLLKKYRGDGDRIVAESCEVALDIMASEQAGEFVPLAPEIAA
jgi:deoxyhypusine monooxygenase